MKNENQQHNGKKNKKNNLSKMRTKGKKMIK